MSPVNSSSVRNAPADTHDVKTSLNEAKATRVWSMEVTLGYFAAVSGAVSSPPALTTILDWADSLATYVDESLEN